MRNTLLLTLWSRTPVKLQWVIKWLMLPKHLLGVVAVIRNEHNELLLFKHSYHPHKPWGLPGGWVNAHERPSRAIVREIKEESGCHVDVIRLLLACESPRRNHLTVVFLCSQPSGEFVPSAEVTDFRYLPLAEIEAQLEQSQSDIFTEICSALNKL
ncbi:MAG: NUDIX hydrolase [Pseudomonadales bacterium]